MAAGQGLTIRRHNVPTTGLRQYDTTLVLNNFVLCRPPAAWTCFGGWGGCKASAIGHQNIGLGFFTMKESLGRISKLASCYSVRYVLHARSYGQRGLPKKYRDLPRVCPGFAQGFVHCPLGTHGMGGRNDRYVQAYGFACGRMPHAGASL